MAQTSLQFGGCPADDKGVAPPGIENAARHGRDGEAGFSLIELLMVLLLLTLVMGASLSLLEKTWRQTPRDLEWNYAMQDTRTAMYRMTRELRQATNLSLISGYRVSGDVVLNGQTQHVLWQCDIGITCTRSATVAPAAAPAQGAGGVVMIRNVQNTTLSPQVPVFSQPATTFLQVVVKVRAAGAVNAGSASHTVTFTDGFDGRNL
jgi:prepilin-type N-terminal cleavage/methylation domain-containing protein